MPLNKPSENKCLHCETNRLELEKARAEISRLEVMTDNAHEALVAVLESGDVMNEHVIEMIKRGLNNQPQNLAD